MCSAVHTQILLYQYFKNDSKDPLAFQNRQYPNQERAPKQHQDQASEQLKRMIEGLNALGFNPPVELVSRRDEDKEPRNYSYPQFTVCSPVTDGPHSLVSVALREAVQKYLDSHPGAFEFAGGHPWVSQTRLITVRPDQKADHLDFNQFLAVVVELPFGDRDNLRSFLEKHNYLVLKREFLRERVWQWKKGDTESSMPTYVLVGREDESPGVGGWVMDIPTRVYNPHTVDPSKTSFVERGYPYVNYIVHERVKHFIQYDYEYVDLGLAVFLHSYLDRDTKGRLQAQANKLTKLMEHAEEADEGKLEEELVEFRKTATEVAKISNAIPEIEMMGRRLTQKYLSPKAKCPTIFQIVNGDNKEFLENSVRAVVQGTKVLQDLFLVTFQQQSEKHRRRVENFLKVISGFAVVLVLKEIWRIEDAATVFTTIGSVLARWHWPSTISAHPHYFYSAFLCGAGLFAILWLYLLFEEKWELDWLAVTLALSVPLALSTWVWLVCGLPIPGLILALVVAAFIATWAEKDSHERSKWRALKLFLAVAAPPLYVSLVLWVGSHLF
jgi:hypothetical protein